MENRNNQIENVHENSKADAEKKSTLSLVKNMLSDESVKKRFESIMGKKAGGFIASISSLVSSTTNFEGTEPKSIIASAVVAATMDLPINPQLGFAYIIPYNNSIKKNGQWIKSKMAQFQMGYKGFIQLAMRTGYYKTMNTVEVFENEIKSYNRITGEIEFDKNFVPKEDSKLVGYVAYFKLLNGFEKYNYMSIEEVRDHAKKYSKTYNKETDTFSSKWGEDFDVMALKTVLKLLLSKYGILSVELQTALVSDQAVISETENGLKYDYSDSATDAEVIEESKQLTAQADGLHKAATGKAPEVESVETEQKEPINLSPDDWENPIKVLAKIESITTKKELAEFKKVNKNKLQAFSGKDYDSIEGALTTQEQKLK